MTSFAAMSVPSAQPAVPQSLLDACKVRPYARANPRRVALEVESIGYLVPGTDFAGRVHSVFAQACNLAWNDTLLTLCASGAGDGPATLRLARGAPDDLRDLFDVGERIHCRQGRARTRRAELRLSNATRLAPGRTRSIAGFRAYRGSPAQRSPASCAAPQCARERSRWRGRAGGRHASGCVSGPRLRTSGATSRSPDRMGRRPDAGR